MGPTQLPKDKIEAFLKECLSNPTKRGEFELRLKDGHTAFNYRVYTTVTAAQCMRVFFPPGTPVDPVEEKKRGEVTTRKLKPDEVDSFLKGLVEHQLWNLDNCKEFGSPDEADLHFTLLQKGTPIFEKVVWEDCKYKDARLGAIMALIAAVSQIQKS